MPHGRTISPAPVGRFRYGLAGLLLLWGSFRLIAFEAEGIRLLVQHSPFTGAIR